MTFENENELVHVISEAKKLAQRYYALTGKPLGISGEIAECEAARLLGLHLSPAREPSVDATQIVGGITVRIQIKGRAVDLKRKYAGRVSKMRLHPEFDTALLVLLDKATFEVIEIWKADYESIKNRLIAPGSKSRNERGSMGISQFKSIAQRVCTNSAESETKSTTFDSWGSQKG